MMEWMDRFPEGFHPQVNLRKQDMIGAGPFFIKPQRPMRYSIVDKFGMSSRRDPSDVSPAKEYSICWNFLFTTLVHNQRQVEVIFFGKYLHL
jgi:hypothetical protein